jgi:hypothetical protein
MMVVQMMCSGNEEQFLLRQQQLAQLCLDFSQIDLHVDHGARRRWARRTTTATLAPRQRARAPSLAQRMEASMVAKHHDRHDDFLRVMHVAPMDVTDEHVLHGGKDER